MSTDNLETTADELVWCWYWKNAFGLASWRRFSNISFVSLRTESCDVWLGQIRKPLLHTMRQWLLYPHEKATLFFVACQKHMILAQRLFTFCQCRLVRTIIDQLSCILFHIRVCMMCDPLSSFHSEAGANISSTFSQGSSHSKILSSFLTIPTLRGGEIGRPDQVKNLPYLQSAEVQRSIRLACLDRCCKEYW